MTDRVLKQLRDDIINNVYEIGELLTEAEISQKFGVSKTPAREALNYLCIEGLLDKIYHRGYIVKQLSVYELQNLLQFRKIVENASISLAVHYTSSDELIALKELASIRVDENDVNKYRKYNELNYDFHVAIARLSKNPYLVAALENTMKKLQRALILDLHLSNINSLLDEHTKLLEAIQDRDLERATQHLQNHMEIIERRIYFKDVLK